jgi:hypothetical protein
VSDPQMQEWIEDGWITVVDKQGYVLTDKGRAAIKGAGAHSSCELSALDLGPVELPDLSDLDLPVTFGQGRAEVERQVNPAVPAALRAA